MDSDHKGPMDAIFIITQVMQKNPTKEVLNYSLTLLILKAHLTQSGERRCGK